MENYKPKAQDVVRCTLGQPSNYRLLKRMSEEDCEDFGVRWTIDGHLQGQPWLAIDLASEAQVALLFGRISSGDEVEDLSKDYVLLEREGIAWQS